MYDHAFNMQKFLLYFEAGRMTHITNTSGHIIVIAGEHPSLPDHAGSILGVEMIFRVI